GYGVWALVAGLLAGSLLNLALVWAKSTWRPQIQFDRDIAYKLFGFGIWVVLEALAVWFHVWGDNLLIGKLIGMGELGISSRAWNINSLIFSLLLNTFFPVLYPTFSRLRDDIQILKRNFHKADTITIALVFPTGTVLLLIGQQLVNILFGVK